MTKIAFVAYYFYDEDGVASLRSRVLSEVLKERGNNLDIITKKTFGEKAQKSKLLWLFFLFIHLMTKDYDKLYVSCGPFWHLRIVVPVCILRRKRFIVDFRDPWSINLKNGFGGSKPKASELNIKRAEFWERLTYKYCEAFWTVTSGMKDAYRETLGSSDKITVVINGHNINIREIENVKRSKNSVLTYVCMGKFVEYGEEKAENALKKVKDVCQTKGKRFLIEFIGAKRDLIEPIVKRLGMESNVVYIPRLPYQQAIQRASNADIGFCIIRDEKLEHGTKTFDYIGLGLPIFDCFSRELMSYKFFRPYLTLTDKKIIPMEVREQFYRKNVFMSYVEMLEK